MCGIFAYCGYKSAATLIYEGLVILQNRGYDSVGITTLNNKKEYTTSKFASELHTSDSINKLSYSIGDHENNNIGIGHTRWATHGAKTIKNAHPHFDYTGRFAIVHNGVIENYLAIKKLLNNNNIKCQTETDTEVIVQLLSLYVHGCKMNVLDALEKTLSKIEGTWGLVILDKENPDSLILTRKGSPLLIGISENEYFISSEISAFSHYTSRYINLNDNEIVMIKDNHIYLNELDNRIQTTSHHDIVDITPDPYEHWTLKEIKEQEFSIFRALNNGGRIYDHISVKLGGLEHDRKKLLDIKNLIILGCGTSKYAGEFGSSLLRMISGFDTVQVVDASEFDSDYLKCPNVGILALSQSGETQDVIRCLKMNKTAFSVVNKPDSTIAKITGCGVYLNAGREVAVASTKAFTSTIAVLTLIAVWYAQNRDIYIDQRQIYIESLNKLPLYFNYLLNDQQTEIECDRVVDYLYQQEKLFILGKGLSAAIANEASLKIKEIGYLHAEGYPGGSLKHGPFALIEKGTPIIIILIDDVHRSYMESTINEVKSRGAYVITITDVLDHDFSDIVIKIPQCNILTPLLSILPLQLIAYKLSIRKGINPDKPRNLAKVVTVI